MNIAEKVLRQKKDFDDVYKAGEGGLWDIIQDYGNRTDYNQGFKNWNGAKTISPKYPIITQNISELFRGCKNLETAPQIFSTNADGKFGMCYMGFYQCYNLKNIDYDIFVSGTTNSSWGQSFSGCGRLVRIKKLGVLEGQPFSSTFNNCGALEEITIEGTIGQNGFDIHWSTKLTAESIDSIVRALTTDKSGLTITLPVGAYNRHAERYGASDTEALWAEKRAYWSINELAV